MKKLLLLIASVVFITSCGGGGGGGSAPSAPTPQNISVSLTSSADSAEVNSSITLTWSSTLATSCSASGSWSGSKSTSGSESITIGVGGSNSFSLSCSATGANSGSASTSVNGLRYFDGKVFDGYIRGAEVFVDINDNLTLDANEASVSTDNAGGFTKLLFGNGTLVSKGGFDLDTGAELSDLTLVHKLDGYETSKLASPFTTLIAYMSTPTNINAALGIDASINLLTTDPIPNLGEGIYDQMYEKGNQLTVLSYTLQNQAAADSSQLYFQAIADQLEESYAANQTAVDIEDPTFISNVIDKAETASAATLSPDVKANLNTVLATTIPLLKVYADSNTTASVQRFAFSTLQNDVQDSTVIGSSSSATINQYENNIFEYVATDQGIDEAAINPINNNAPTISSSTTFSSAENQTSIGNISASDADGDSLTYSISGSEINISNSGVLTFATAPDYETKNSYTATVTVSDGAASVTQSITVTISDVDETVPNEAPSISSAATFSVAENNTNIGSVSASDADGDSLTYSISGSEINISNSGVLTFATAPDYETKNSYTAIVTVSDGTNSVTQSITVTITDVDETDPNESPTISSSTTFSAAENQTSIGSISASDADGDSLTYTISGSEINISSSGVLTFASAPNYETKSSYTATVTVSDGTVSITQNITINITDVSEAVAVNDTSSGIEDDNIRVDVLTNDTFSALDVTLTATDGSNMTVEVQNDATSVAEYGRPTIIYSPDANWFGTDSFTYTVSSGGESDQGTVTVTVTSVNDAPVISSSATFSAAENQTAIGSVTATDADGDSLTYSITGSEINISSSGVLSFATAPDYETKTSYTATVTVSDGTASTTQNITVNITDVVEAVPNAAPTISSSATFSAAENQTAIGSVTATDADGDSLTYSISGSEINISSSGVLTFVSAPDYETKTSYSATVTVSDGTASTTQDITVNITDVNEAPTISSSSTFTIAENQTSLGSVTANDPENQTLTYALIQLPAPLAGEQYAGASINSSTGVITLGGTGFNYEERTSITARIEVSDGTNAVTQDITVSITDLPQGTVTQLGSALTSSTVVTFEALALSGNGLTLVYRKDIPDTDLDSVAVVSYQLGSWSQIGSDIVAEAGELGFGNSVAISDDGTIIAIGVTPESDIGLVKVYKHSSGSWSQLGSDISGIHAGDYFGYATSLSNDGTILAIGATDIADENNGPGAASVYQYSNGAWTKLGSTINGVDANDWFGRSVSLSGNGQILAIGSDRHDGGKGEARIYQYDSGSWSQLGSDINGNTDDRLGRAVSLSDDGSIIALGNNPAGQSKVFQYDSGSWSQLGSNITSSNPYIGLSATISDDGTRVTFGGIGDSDTYPGSFVTYKFSSNNWTSIASVSSSNVADRFGWATSTSNDGSIVAAGDYNVNGDSNNALAKIYKVEIEN